MLRGNHMSDESRIGFSPCSASRCVNIPILIAIVAAVSKLNVTTRTVLRTPLMLMALGLVAACAQQPIIDTKGVNIAQYEQDKKECSAYAEQVSVAQKAGTGAVAGAAVGAVIGAAVGNSDTAARGAGIGAASGAAKGTGRGISEKQRVVRNCLRHRGYAVLN